MNRVGIINESAIWDAYFERLLREWKYKALKRRKHHIEAYRLNMYIYYWCIVPAGVIQGLAGSTALVSLVDNPLASLILKITCAILSFISVGILTLGITLGFQDKATKHKVTADQYESLFDLIKNITQSPIAVRGDPATVLENLRSMYDDIIKNAPPIDMRDEDFSNSDSSTASTIKPDLSKILIDVDTDIKPLEILLTDTPPSEKVMVEDKNIDNSPKNISTNVQLHAMKVKNSINKGDTPKQDDIEFNSMLKALEFEIQRMNKS